MVFESFALVSSLFKFQIFSVNLWKAWNVGVSLSKKKRKRGWERLSCWRKYSFDLGKDHEGITIVIWEDILSVHTLFFSSLLLSCEWRTCLAEAVGSGSHMTTWSEEGMVSAARGCRGLWCEKAFRQKSALMEGWEADTIGWSWRAKVRSRNKS